MAKRDQDLVASIAGDVSDRACVCISERESGRRRRGDLQRKIAGEVPPVAVDEDSVAFGDIPFGKVDSQVVVVFGAGSPRRYAVSVDEDLEDRSVARFFSLLVEQEVAEAGGDHRRSDIVRLGHRYRLRNVRAMAPHDVDTPAGEVVCDGSEQRVDVLPELEPAMDAGYHHIGDGAGIPHRLLGTVRIP